MVTPCYTQELKLVDILISSFSEKWQKIGFTPKFHGLYFLFNYHDFPKQMPKKRRIDRAPFSSISALGRQGGLGGLGGPSSPPLAPFPRIEAISMGIVGWFHRKMVILWELYGDFQGFYRDDVFFFILILWWFLNEILCFLFLDLFPLDIIGI